MTLYARASLSLPMGVHKKRPVLRLGRREYLEQAVEASLALATPAFNSHDEDY